eukprot:13370704-Alexandrium_andersonii.AAC.1
MAEWGVRGVIPFDAWRARSHSRAIGPTATRATEGSAMPGAVGSLRRQRATVAVSSFAAVAPLEALRLVPSEATIGSGPQRSCSCTVSYTHLTLPTICSV